MGNMSAVDDQRQQKENGLSLVPKKDLPRGDIIISFLTGLLLLKVGEG